MNNEKRSNRNGIVYVLQNPSFQENVIKIGFTTNLKQRMSDLYKNSGVPSRFTCYYARQVGDAKFVEKKLHAGLSSRRINPDREFFELDPEEAKSLIEIAQGEDVTPNNELEDATNFEKRLAKKNMFRLYNYGIQPGSTLTYVKDSEINAVVNSDGKSITLGDKAPEDMQGKEYSLSGAASQLAGYRVAGPDHWKYKGKTLNEIRNDTDSFGES